MLGWGCCAVTRPCIAASAPHGLASPQLWVQPIPSSHMGAHPSLQHTDTGTLLHTHVSQAQPRPPAQLHPRTHNPQGASAAGEGWEGGDRAAHPFIGAGGAIKPAAVCIGAAALAWRSWLRFVSTLTFNCGSYSPPLAPPCPHWGRVARGAGAPAAGGGRGAAAAAATRHDNGGCCPNRCPSQSPRCCGAGGRQPRVGLAVKQLSWRKASGAGVTH